MAEYYQRREMTGPGPEPAPRVVGRLTDAAPLAMAAFALPLFIWSAFNAHFFDPTDETFLIPLAIFLGGPIALLSAMWAYAHRDAYLGTAAGVFGAFWFSYGMILWLSKNGTVSPTSMRDLLGLLFIAWAVTFGILWVASMRAHWALSLISLGAAAMFVLLSIGYYRDRTALTDSNFLVVGGWVGFVTAGLTWYGALAHLLNVEFERPVLPTNMDWFRQFRAPQAR